MIKVLIAEDSPTTLKALTYLLEDDPEIQVVGQAENGKQAIEMAKQLDPDIITMDIVMPDIDGLEATREIMANRPTPILIITAFRDSSELNIVFEAMKAGAVEVIDKPKGIMGDTNKKWEQELIVKIKTLATVLPRSMTKD